MNPSTVTRVGAQLAICKFLLGFVSSVLVKLIVVFPFLVVIAALINNQASAQGADYVVHLPDGGQLLLNYEPTYLGRHLFPRDAKKTVKETSETINKSFDEQTTEDLVWDRKTKKWVAKRESPRFEPQDW
jgi:predicted PurR-regulated permease PerM